MSRKIGAARWIHEGGVGRWELRQEQQGRSSAAGRFKGVIRRHSSPLYGHPKHLVWMTMKRAGKAADNS